jgi:hypothetical protein
MKTSTLHGSPHSSPLFVLLTIILATSVAFAGTTARLSGRVIDTRGVIITGAKVQAVKLDTSVTYLGETNTVGRYSIPNLPPGTYRLIVSKFGFRTVDITEIKLEVQEEKERNIHMELGSAEEIIAMETGAPLIQSDAQRGGNFLPFEIQALPLISLNPISLARTLPGAIEPAGGSHGISTLAEGEVEILAVNGARPRGNSYLLDSTENNDIHFNGIAQPFNMADAVEDVSVQTSNFGVEFGRASGGIFNVVTKSGTNGFHGTVLWRYQSQSLNSVSNVDKLNQTPQAAFTHNVYGMTVGGPVRKGKTFFFAGFQQDTVQAGETFFLVVPTAEAVGTLRSIFPVNPRLDLYLNLLGSLRGTANPIGMQLGIDPLTGTDRGTVQFASAPLGLSVSDGGPQWLGRLDHSLSESHHLAFRYIFDTRTNSPTNVYFPGFVLDQAARNQNLLLTDQFTFSSSWANEFRFSYGRQVTDQRRISAESISLAQTLPRINIASIDSPGVASILLLNREVNNLLFQETQTKLIGRHTLSYGVEFLQQLAMQRPASRFNGEFTYTGATGYSAFANFLDDYSGPSGEARRDFGATIFHPNQFHQTYFFQDRWLPTPSLSLTLGLRYENFGQPANVLQYPAFSGFNPDDFLKPNRVNTDNNNFGPSFGLAWSPSLPSSWLGRLIGNNKTVWRGGYQISYDAFFTQTISLLLATSSPNAISIVNRAVGKDRGAPEWFEKLPIAPNAPSLLDAQQGVLEKNLRSPYMERWSFGFQREFSSKLLLDGSYVGSESHKLTTWDNVNPRQPDGQLLHPDFGPRQIRAGEGNASYHAMQWRLDRRFADGIRLAVSYTWSHNIDSSSEGVSTINNQTIGGNRTWIPVSQGGLKLDRASSDYDRTHRLTVLSLWNIRGPSRGIWNAAFGGWSLNSIFSFQSGAPFTIQNGRDRNDDGNAVTDRPDIGNPSAPLNSRAVLAPVSADCFYGYLNPDTNSCVNPADVHWIQGTGLPNASTAGRNTLRAGGINNVDLSLSKSFRIGEQGRLEFRWDAFNALNHPQFTQIPDASVVGSASPQYGLPSHFLNRDFTDSGIRSMWLQLKLVF